MTLSALCFEAETLDDLLGHVLRPLLQDTDFITASKGRFTEMVGAHLLLHNPRARLSRSESRGKLFSAVGEFLWYMSGENSFQFIDYYIPNGYDDETEDRVVVNSGYGRRLFGLFGVNQIENVIATLRDRPTSRQAVIQIYSAQDLGKKSVPCTCTLQFIIRQERLNLLVNMRSNDAFLGLPHDIFAFTMIQELIARSLGIEPGPYQHIAGSLHLYEKHREKAAEYIDEGWQNEIPMAPMPRGDQWGELAKIQAAERNIREHGNADISRLELDVYWRDICLLLAIYRKVKDGDLTGCEQLKAELQNKSYYTFVDSRISP